MEGKPVQLKGVIAQEGGHDVGRAARDHDRSDSRNDSQVQWLCDIRRLLLPATRKKQTMPNVTKMPHTNASTKIRGLSNPSMKVSSE
jgi:hypothetical protein